MGERSIFHLPTWQCKLSDRLRRHRWPVRFLPLKNLCVFIQHSDRLSRFGLGDIALDDIVVYDTCPNQDRLCTFEDPKICDFVNDAASQYNWVRTTGDDPLASGFKPSIDHTDGTSNGAYIFVDLSRSSPTANNQRARLISPTVTPNGEQCVEYWYYTDAEILSSASKLNLYVRSVDPPTNATGFLIATQSVSRVSELDRQRRSISLTPSF
jgi:hypothetical protein